jgi:hypothetical protein
MTKHLLALQEELSASVLTSGMEFERNVGGRNRTVRAILGVGLLDVAYRAFLLSRTTAIAAILASTGLLFNVVSGHWANKLLGINTCSSE